MPDRDIVVGGDVCTKHMVQLFDTAESRTDAVSDFIRDGLLDGDVLLIVIADDHWNAVASRLRAIGVEYEEPLRSGWLVVRDARDSLKLFMRHGRPDRTMFHRTIGRLVSELGAGGGRLRVFGEMVDLLAEAGDYRSAQQLEDLWNELAEQEPFTLFCGYSSINFGDPRSGEALRLICRSHSHVRSDTRDILGSFLVEEYSGERPKSDAYR